jgi:hypothetical protein
MTAPVRKYRVVARYGRDTAIVQTFAAEHKAKQLLDELRREHRGHHGAAFWLTTRKRQASSSWGDLQGRILRGERPLPPVAPEITAEEDAILAKGGTIRRLVWRPL